MPYLQLNVSKAMSHEEKHRLCEEIGALMPIIPGKNRQNTMIHIADGQFMELGDEGPSLYLELRLYKPSPEEAKKQFVEKISALLCERLGVDPARMYMNLVEMDAWGSGGALRS